MAHTGVERPAARKPKISIITPSFNTGKFLEDTVQSILAQSFTDFEHIVIDAGSTDTTLAVLKKYPHIKWISEKDDDYWEAFRKGMAMAEGEYMMNCCVSDGYLDKDWFRTCVDILDKDPELSLVWGLTRYMTEDGKLSDTLYKQFATKTPPQKTDYFYYWLATYDPLPENNLCARRSVFEACYPLYKKEYAKKEIFEIDAWNEFVYNFHSLGYLSYCVPTVASFGRIHGGQRSELERKSGKSKVVYANFINKAKAYHRSVIWGRGVHHFKDGEGKVLPYLFSKWKFLREEVFSFYGIRRSVLRGSAFLVRPVARWMLSNAAVPQGIQKMIKRLKDFYGVRQ